ncbi:MAG: hypothetical protein ACPGRC_09310 [Salibacteraceae bacterium]
MKKSFLRFVSFFLMLAITSTFIPVEFFHQAQHSHVHSHCDADNVALESDPCHISLYHAQSVEHTCEHNSHATETEEECELCKFITTKRAIQLALSCDQVYSFTFLNQYSTTPAPAWVWNSSLSIKGRAPPTV